MLGEHVDISRRETFPKRVGLLPDRRMDQFVGSEKVSDQAVHKDRPDEALLDEDRIVPQPVVDLAEPVRHTAVASEAVNLRLERLRCQGLLPELFEGDGLAEICPDLGLQKVTRHGRLEWLRRPDLV